MATVALLVLCVGGFVASDWFAGPLDSIGLLCCGAKDRALITGFGEWWRLGSAGFLHASVLHLVVNLFALVMLGPTVERLWGTPRFVILYVAALAGGNTASLAVTPAVSVGASGAIFGLFGAVVVFATAYRRFVMPAARRRLWVNLAIVAAANVAIGLSVPFIDNAAHAGGLVVGALAALLLRPVPARGTPNAALDGLVRLVAAASAVAVAWSLGEAIEYARSSDWILLARTRLEPRSLEGSGFRVSVPRGWDYEKPGPRGGYHSFSRPGLAVVSVRLVPPEEGLDVAAFVKGRLARLQAEGMEPVSRREILVRDQPGDDVQVRRKQERITVRRRDVAFLSPFGRLVSVVCECEERRYPLLEVIFDEVIQSIQVGPPRPGGGEALALWERLARDPRDVEACLGLAAAYRTDGRPAAAEQMLRLALAVQPDSADAYDQLSYLYATASPPYRRPRRAIECARRAVDLDPGNPRHLASLAIACQAAGDLASALEAARRAAELAPTDARYAGLVAQIEREMKGAK